MSGILGQDRVAALRQRLRDRQTWTSGPAIVGYLALFDFIIHMLVAGNYGYFRDELYYIESGRHLAFGYVDFPFLIAWLGALMNLIAGDALVAIHIIPALAGASLAFITGMMARELGGGRLAQALAALGTLVTLVFLATASIFSMDILDALWWSLAAFVVIRLIKRQQPQLWLLFGLVAGIGLTTKLTMLFFGFALVVGLLATPMRSTFRERWIWLGGAIAFLFLLPYVIWNVVNGWPTLEFWHNYGGLSGGGPIGFLGSQIFAVNPFNIPLIVAGLLFYFRDPRGKSYRVLGWAWVALYVLFTLINAKSYFLAPAYPMIYAGGALGIEQLARRANRGWAAPATMAAMALSGAFFAPLAMPLLPPASFVSHYGFLTGAGNGSAGQQNAGQFPQYLGDRFGWNTMTATIAHVYDGLPPAQRAQACIFTSNYGEASALILLGAKDHLPPVISGHNNFYLWGPGTCGGAVIITVGQSQSDDLQSYASVTQVATITCSYCMASEDDLPVYLCTHPKFSVRDLWRQVKHFN